MKKISTFIIALTLIFGMAQCNKDDQGKWVHISMSVDNGGKHIVYPNTGAVMYNEGDKVYVGNNNHYIGTLTFHDGTFSGDILSPSTADYLHFYFVGGLSTGTLTAGSTNSIDVNIADQRTQLPVLSYGHSANKYSETNTDYYCMLLNKCALVKFNLTHATDDDVIVSGLPHWATIDFSNTTDAISVSTANSPGDITLYPASLTERWAILLPGTNLTGLNAHVGGQHFAVDVEGSPEINSNSYINSGIQINNTSSSPVTNGYFTINSSNQQVFFSQGNLQATTTDGTNWTWSFAANQYDYIGNAVANTLINGSMSASGSGTVDLFGWNGLSSTLDNYGIHNSKSNAMYGNTAGENLKNDWGHNSIGGETDKWFSLTPAEWDYVFNGRSTSSGVLFAKAQVNTVPGIILLPDDWSTSYHALNSANSSSANFTANSIDLSDWTNDFEAHGAVFLPAAGRRNGTDVSNSGVVGNYWTKTSYDGDATKANCFTFNNSSLNVNLTTTYASRCLGHSVRLVCNAN